MSITKQDIIEDLQFRIRHNRISKLKQLNKRCEEENLDAYEDVLEKMEWNSCERCGELYPSDKLYWEGYDWGYENEDLIKGMKEEKKSYCALCPECVKKLIEKGRGDEILFSK